MIKILHSADWHLDAPLKDRNPDGTQLLQNALRQVPQMLLELCKKEGCQLVLLSGDLFDGPYSHQTCDALCRILGEMEVPVFIAPGNHDYAGGRSPWLTEAFPENVHIFTRPAMEYVDIAPLNCRVYGAGYDAMDCPGLLEQFHADSPMKYNLGVLHGDPTVAASPYCPVTSAQIRDCGLDYLALGHIHKGGQLRLGKTVCAWPGCPMGRGYDETGIKGALIVTVDETVEARFVPLDTPRFYDLEVNVGDDLKKAVERVLPATASSDFYRITLTGDCEAPDLNALLRPDIPNLVLRDRTVLPVDVWSSADSDSLEGTYFSLLHQALDGADPETRNQIHLAARISRQLLDGQEVTLP